MSQSVSKVLLRAPRESSEDLSLDNAYKSLSNEAPAETTVTTRSGSGSRRRRIMDGYEYEELDMTCCFFKKNNNSIPRFYITIQYIQFLL